MKFTTTRESCQNKSRKTSQSRCSKQQKKEKKTYKTTLKLKVRHLVSNIVPFTLGHLVNNIFVSRDHSTDTILDTFEVKVCPIN